MAKPNQHIAPAEHVDTTVPGATALEVEAISQPEQTVNMLTVNTIFVNFDKEDEASRRLKVASDAIEGLEGRPLEAPLLASQKRQKALMERIVDRKVESAKWLFATLIDIETTPEPAPTKEDPDRKVCRAKNPKEQAELDARYEAFRSAYAGPQNVDKRILIHSGKAKVIIPPKAAEVATVAEDFSDKLFGIEATAPERVKVRKPRVPKIEGRKIDVGNAKNPEALALAAQLLLEYFTAKGVYNQLSSDFDLEKFIKEGMIVNPSFLDELKDKKPAAEADLKDYLYHIGNRNLAVDTGNLLDGTKRFTEAELRQKRRLRDRDIREVYQIAKRSAIGAIALEDAVDSGIIPKDVLADTPEQTFNNLDVMYAMPGANRARERYRNALKRVIELHEYAETERELAGVKKS